MKQEDKELLLKDLCARLPYGVKVGIGHESSLIQTVEVVGKNICGKDSVNGGILTKLKSNHISVLCQV